MKQISLWATIIAMIVCGITITSCSKDEEKDNNGGEKEKVSNLDDYVDKYCIRCERVGANLVVEVVFENITDNAINDALLKLKDGKITDNIGNVYYVDAGGATTAYLTNTTDINTIPNYGNKWTSMNIPAKGYVIYFIKILNFDSSNKATKISFDLTFSSSSLPADNYDVTAHDFIITDNRVMENGIQTNDTALVYQVTNCERVGAVLQIDFNVTNDSEIEMGNLTFSCADKAVDNLGNTYYTNLSGYGDLAFGAGGYKNIYTLQLKPHETIKGRIRINNFDTTNKAKSASIPLSCTSSSYVFSDDVVRFITIPLKDNRILYGGIQSPDLKLDINFVSATLDENRYLIVNYTITNNTGDNLTNLTFKGDSNILDDLSNSYYNNSMKFSFNGSDFTSAWWVGAITNIAAGATISAAIKVETPFNANAKNVTFDIGLSSDNYEFVDSKIYFITIPIQR